MRRLVPATIVALVALTGCSSSEPTDTVPAQTGPTENPTGATGSEAIGEPANVTRVIDGDTIEVALDNEIVAVRLIGIDTPETVNPTEPVECYGPAASRFTTSALEGRPVRLEFDVERLDRYGRTLAYVWLDSELFNETLVARGFAQVTTYPPNVRYVDGSSPHRQTPEATSEGSGELPATRGHRGDVR